MSRFENKIYIQTPHSCVRNKTITNFNTSSDFCVFTTPTFDMVGATKIEVCSSTDDCTLSGDFETLYLSARTQCFTDNSLEESCLDLTHYETIILEDGEIIYSADFYTSTAYTGDYPTNETYKTSLITAFDSLGYNYSYSGLTFTIEKPFGTTQLNLDTNINFDLADDCMYSVSGTCGCPTGYTETLDGLECFYSGTTAATFNGLGSIIISGDVNTVYSDFGTYFYTNETENQSLPLTRVTNVAELEDQSGGTISYTNRSDSGNTFWDSIGSSANGRLNNVGISASTSEWLGFSYCLDIISGGTYYIGMGADNRCNFSVDGELFVELGASHDKNFKQWHIFPYDFVAGKHIIEMEGLNGGSDSSFGAEIYNPTDLATLTGATTTGDTGLIFSTADKVGDTFDLGTTIGYSCPSGYALDLCGASATCTELIYTGKTTDCFSAYTGTCVGITTNLCDYEFSAITSANTGVHIITTATTQDITFDFTGDTSSFIDGNTTFKYEIFKFDNNLGYFHNPPQYQSEEIEWSEFSGTSALTQSIELSSLSIDGDYLVKGYFVHDVCTEFAKQLGYRNDTSLVKTGDSFGLYEPATDYYMSIFKIADTPIFGGGGNQPTELISLLQRVIIPEDGQTVFILPDTVKIDFIVTLNGLSLSSGYDYTITQYSAGTNPYVVTLTGETNSSDIVTFIYGSTGIGGLKTDSIDVTSIPSGITDGEGDNDIYLNTTTGKYEMFLTLVPSSSNDILVMLNGVTLANGVDYYQSISNPKRIIFTGTILVGDMIIAAYNQSASFVESINSSRPNIGWKITNAPIKINGRFILEFASDNNMTTQVSSGETNYIVGSTSYSLAPIISGTVGTQLYYRVTNIKEYTTICGDIIQSMAYSDIIPITIATNSINSY